jgi:phosphoglycerate dehydrogenase-like enzyme
MMSEFVFGYLLMIERQILLRWQAQQRGEWDDRPYGTLNGKLIGLLGVGTIGAHLAATAKHLGMRVYGSTRQRETSHDVDQYFHAGSSSKFLATWITWYAACLGPMQQKELLTHNFWQTCREKHG